MPQVNTVWLYIHVGIYIMNRGSCWPNGSYFAPNELDVNPIHCGHDAALDGTNDGGWILPSDASCNSTTSPFQCTVATNNPANITLLRVGLFSAAAELVYKCCLPNDCDNGSTDIIIANIYGKLLSDVTSYYFCIGQIFIVANTFDPPSDITAIPQSYTVHCVIVRSQATLSEDFLTEFHYYYKDTSSDIELTNTSCMSQTGYDCTIGPDDTTVTTDVSPDPPTDRPITVTWEAEEISSGAFRQNNNNGDHEIECYARRNAFSRMSTVTIEGIYYAFLCQVIYSFLAPSSSPTSITVVSTTTTSITVNWMYDTSDADGYVVYYNGTAKLVGGDMKETTLDGLIPGTSYSITVRAYQDILGPPSTTLNTATDDGKLRFMSPLNELNVKCYSIYISQYTTCISTNRPTQ